MKRSPSAKQAVVQEDELKKYTIYSAFEIGRILNGVKQERQLIRVRFADSQQESVTAILAVDTDRKTLILDTLSEPGQEALAVKSDRLHFEGKHNRITITFTTGAAKPVRFDGVPALSVAFPERLTRLQRREFFRVFVRDSSVQVPIQEQSVRFSIRDISQAGCCLIDPGKHMRDKVGQILPDCILALSGVQELTVALEVCSSYDITRPDGQRQRLAGCRFAALESAKAALLQRYVMQVERKSRALTG